MIQSLPRKHTVQLSGFRLRKLELFLNLESGGQLSRVRVELAGRKGAEERRLLQTPEGEHWQDSKA